MVVESVEADLEISRQILVINHLVSLDIFGGEMPAGGRVGEGIVEFIGVRGAERPSIEQFDCAVRPGVANQAQAWTDGAPETFIVIIPPANAGAQVCDKGHLILEIESRVSACPVNIRIIAQGGDVKVRDVLLQVVSDLPAFGEGVRPPVLDQLDLAAYRLAFSEVLVEQLSGRCGIREGGVSGGIGDVIKVEPGHHFGRLVNLVQILEVHVSVLVPGLVAGVIEEGIP